MTAASLTNLRGKQLIGVCAKRVSWRGKVVSVDGCPITTRYNNMNRRRIKVLGRWQGRRKEGNRKVYWLCSVSHEREDRSTVRREKRRGG